MKAYKGAEVQLQLISTSALDGGGCSTSGCHHFILKKDPWYQLSRRAWVPTSAVEIMKQLEDSFQVRHPLRFIFPVRRLLLQPGIEPGSFSP
jgi:hypothetical protein